MESIGMTQMPPRRRAPLRSAVLLNMLLVMPSCGPRDVESSAGSGGAGNQSSSTGSGGAGAGGIGGAAGSGGTTTVIDPIGGAAGASAGASAGGSSGNAGSGGATTLPKKINVLAIAEYDENHAPFVIAAKEWLATETDLTITYLENPNTLTDELLSDFGLILQLNYPPFSWDPGPKTAFEKYITEGKGGWVGLHHASLYGPVVTDQSWPWFHTFLGGVNFKGYIASFAAADVRVEATTHPIFDGVPATFNVATDEWYTWDVSPRAKATVLANVNEDTYEPDSSVKMGDHPVVWTNEAYAAKNVYIFMGHHPNLLDNEAYVTLLRNAIFWAGTEKP